jgi:hypothetical protein
MSPFCWNAFHRNWESLLPFCREFYRRHRRLPIVDEALDHLRSKRLFSGRWSDNEERRRRRVADILRKIAETFDPSLLSGGHVLSADAKVRQWCWRHFPNGLTASRQIIDEIQMMVHRRHVHVPARFVAHLMQIIVFCLREDPLENGALPTNRIKVLWGRLPNAPAWNQTYFQLVRDHLDRIGVIEIFDRQHTAGKAWRWRMGPNFPGRRQSQSWRSPGGKPKDMSVEKRKNKTHNSLYYSPLPNFQNGSNFTPKWTLSRPPPRTLASIHPSPSFSDHQFDSGDEEVVQLRRQLPRGH